MYAAIAADALTLTALVALPDGTEFIRHTIDGARGEAEGLASELAERLLSDGARELLERAEAMHD
jgi:hydroxymethylbilane synthase